MSFTRRSFLATTAALAAGTSLPGRAQTTTQLTGIDWGGPLIEATRKISESDKDVAITWELHSGGAGTVLPKIKSAWPNPKYDIVAAWNPVYVTMINEAWLEPLTVDELPNLRDVPTDYFFKDKSGAIVNVPRS